MKSSTNNYPAPQEFNIPYKKAPAPANPVFRGLALSIGSTVVASLPTLQSYLWSNAGFNRLRNHPALEHVDALYTPAVIPIAPPGLSAVAAETYTRAQEQRPLSKDTKNRFYSVTDFHEAYISGKLTPTAVVDALLPLIRRDVEKPSVHATAFLQTRVDLVKAAAEASTRRYKEGKSLGVLDGVPVGVKDEADITGYKKTFGTKMDFTDKQDRTSWAVAKWEEAGAIMMGKLNMHEIGFDTSNNNPNHGTPLNPHNEHYYTGGSSGGSGYVVGSGLVPIAMGMDGGGSIRIPSSWCGAFGLKTSHHRVSGRPSPSACVTTGVIGPIASNMADLEVAFRVMAAPDPQDSNSRLFSPPARLTASEQSQRPKVLGVYKTWFERADPPVREACEKALDYFTSKLGYTIVDISIPLIHEGQLAHTITIMSEIASSNPNPSAYTPANKVLLAVGSQCPSIDFIQAQKVRHLIMQHLTHLFEKHPGLIIVTPTTPNAGWHIKGGKSDLAYGISDGNQSIRNMEFVWLANFTGLPSLSFPVAYLDPAEGEGQVPIGLMGNGEWGSEDALIEWGYDGEAWLNEGLEGGRRRPKNWVDVLNL